MTWTTDRPTRPGFYWLRETDQPPVVVKVGTNTNGELYAVHPDQPEWLDLATPPGLTSDLDPEAAWWGPLEVPT